MCARESPDADVVLILVYRSEEVVAAPTTYDELKSSSLFERAGIVRYWEELRRTHVGDKRP